MSKTSELRELSYSGILLPLALTDRALEVYYCSARYHEMLREVGTEEHMIQYYPRERRMPMTKWDGCSIRAGEIIPLDRPVPWSPPPPDAPDGYPQRLWEKYRIDAVRVVDVYVGYHKKTRARCKLVRIGASWFPEDVILKINWPDRYHRFTFSYPWQEVSRYDIYFWVWHMNAEPVELYASEIDSLQQENIN